MLRTNYILQFKDNRDSKKMNFENEDKSEDENFIFNSCKPLNETHIKSLSEDKLQNFVEKIMTHKKVSSVLYSSSAGKQIQLVERMNRNLKQPVKVKVNKGYDPQNVVKERAKLETIAKMLEENKAHKIKLQEEKIKLNEKNENWYETELKNFLNIQQQNIRDNENKYRIDRIYDVFEKIKDKHYNKIIDLPDVELDTKDVFCRLFNSVVHLEKKKQPVSNRRSNSSILGSSSSTNLGLPHNVLNSLKSNKLHVKKLVKCSDGKEFTMKINDEILMNCFSHNSGGPEMRCTNLNENPDQVSKNPIYKFRDDSGNTMLHLAVLDNQIEIVRYMIIKKLAVNAVNNDGDSPLHLALKMNNQPLEKSEVVDSNKIIKILFDSGADIDIMNNSKETPVDYASSEIKKQYSLDSKLMQKRWDKQNKIKKKKVFVK